MDAYLSIVTQHAPAHSAGAQHAMGGGSVLAEVEDIE